MRTPRFARLGRAGFSLGELTIALVVLGVLVLVAAPSMTSWVRGSRLGGAVNEVNSDITVARLRAIRAGQQGTFTVLSSTTYRVAVNGTTLKTISLANDYKGVTLEPTNFSLTFNSRGLCTSCTSTQSLRLTSSTGQRRTLSVNTIGKVTSD